MPGTSNTNSSDIFATTVSTAKFSSLFSDMDDVAILSTRETITNNTPTIASRLVRTTVRIRAEPAGSSFLDNFLSAVSIFSNLIVQINNVCKGSAFLYNPFGIIQRESELERLRENV